MDHARGQAEIGSPEFRPTSDIIAALLAFLAFKVLAAGLIRLMERDLVADPLERFAIDDALRFSGRYLMTALVGVLLYLRRSPLEHIVLGGLLAAVGLILPELGLDPRIGLGLVAMALPLIHVSAYVHLADQIPAGNRLADVAFLGVGVAILVGGFGSGVLVTELPVGGRTLVLLGLAGLVAALMVARPVLRLARLVAVAPGVLALGLVLVLLWRFDLAQTLMSVAAPLGLIAALILLADLRVGRKRSLPLLLAAFILLEIGADAFETARRISPWPDLGGIFSLFVMLVPAVGGGVVVLVMSSRGSRRRLLAASFIVAVLVCSTILFMTAPGFGADVPLGAHDRWNRIFFVFAIEQVAALVAGTLLVAGLLLETRERWRPLVVTAVIGLAPFVTGWSTNKIWNDRSSPGEFVPGPIQLDSSLNWTATGVLAVIALLLFWRSRDDPGAMEDRETEAGAAS